MVLTLAVAWASLLSAGELVAVADAGDEQRTSTTCGSPAIDAGSARAVQAILEAGFSGPSVDPAAIERLAAAAGKTGERDSRVEYARGLVLLKHLKHREAVAAFDSATRAGPPCLPAWQALVRSRLTLKEGDAALALAEQLAAQLTDANAAWPNACRSEAATWLGRLAGYLALDGVELVQPPAVLTAHEVRMRLSLGEGLAEAYAAGRANVHREHQGLLKQRALARTEIAADQQKQSQDRTAAVAEERAELDQQAETLKMTVREWQAWLDEVLRRTEKQLTVLQKDFAALDAAAREISSEIAARTRELAALRFSTEAALPSRQNTSGFPSQFQLEALERENQIGRLQSQFDALAAKANVISSQARGLLAERSAAARQFQQATGQLARQDATIQKWEKLLEKSAARNEPKDATRTNAYRALTTRLTLVATYFELDLEAERKRLLAELVAEPVSGQ